MGAGKSMTPDERAKELSRIRNGMIRKSYYLMHRRPLEPQRKAEVMLEHFQWIVELEKRGQIVFSGALFDREGVQGEGLTLLRARDWDEAERLAETDPFVMAGGRLVQYRSVGNRRRQPHRVDQPFRSTHASRLTGFRLQNAG